MKFNRWVALALIAVLGVGAMGFVSYRVFASTNLFQMQDCAPDTEENEAGETAKTEDADAGECESESEDESTSPETNEANESDETAPSTTGITADQAKGIVEAAYAGASARNVEFEREWGKEIWEVELDNGSEVMVDAATGEILGTETGE
jgi:uncharacterized membrane protein YkoI